MRDDQYKLIVDAARRRGATFPTQNDWLDFKAAIDAAVEEAAPEIPASTAPAPLIYGLADEAAFFAKMRGTKVLGATLSSEEVEGCQRIIGACKAAGWPVAWTAYALATAYHETAGTLRPIREYGRGKGRRYGRPGKHGQIAYGRGYVQLTWDYNYERADKELGLGGALIGDYELALDPKVAADIMIRGMAEGWFTIKKNATYLPASGPATRQAFANARKIINGTDKADLIAGHAMEFQAALLAGGWQGRG